MSAKVIGYNGEVRCQNWQRPPPRIPGRANTVDEEQRRAIAFDAEGAIQCLSHPHQLTTDSLGALRVLKCGMTSSAKH